MENTNYKIKRVCRENLADLVFLFKEVKDVDIPIEYFVKKFDTSFCGSSYIGFFAYDLENRPAAFYGVYPCFLNINGNQILVAQSGDTITHINHQKKGLFTMLAQRTYELAQSESIKLIFGFPNINSYHGFVHKLNWVHVEDFEDYRIKTNCIPIFKMCAKLGYMSLYYMYLNFFLCFIKNVNLLRNSNDYENFYFVERNQKFYEYKKYEKNFLIKFSDIKIWFKIEEGLLIGDVELNGIDVETYFKKLKILCFFLGLHCMKFSVSPKSNWSKKLQSIYPYTKGGAIIYLCFDDSIDINNIKFSAGDSDTF